jgi:hypothetical protein
MSAGKWRSQRTTHHLAFKRTETGESEIVVETLAVDRPEAIAVCELHQVDPARAVSASQVRWQGTMAWDKDDEDHQGQTVFVIVPDADRPRQGQLLREKGYAEIVPVAGRYLMDDEDGLVLITEYETMSSHERFWFPNPNLRLRISTVKRFGGFSTASFCAETRIESDSLGIHKSDIPQQGQDLSESQKFYSVLGW